MSLRDEAASNLVKEITATTPTRARRVFSKWRKTEHVQSQMSGEEAVSLIISSELTKSQYKILRDTAISHGHKLYPSYETVKKAKFVVYPDGILATEDACEVNMKALLLHTASRIVASVFIAPSIEK
ncbi:hypothetical protein J437_LFUL018647 [Ladona fulva]|uniref:Uncharacterized protein n=1 Tax=Ladona fulva TaxID=123851 RepID=A0A8K0KSZ1_LADFU|nr:hypothetical protein J437_LFUL018647 [Ladona fulva]